MLAVASSSHDCDALLTKMAPLSQELHTAVLPQPHVPGRDTAGETAGFVATCAAETDIEATSCRTGNPMVSQDSLLVTLVHLVDRLPMPKFPTKRGRGHPQVYSDRLFLKALVIMIVRHLHTVHELLSVLAQPTREMQRLREVLSE